MVNEAINPLLVRHAQEILDLWQARALIHARGKTAAVLLSVIAHSYDDGVSMLVLLKTAFPGFTTITAPFFCTAAKIAKTGWVVADLVTRDGTIDKDTPIYRDETELHDDFRRLADELALSEVDRIEMLAAVKRWIVADRRLDPNFDPKDPDAKRLTLH